jgi:hypothetical protein
MLHVITQIFSLKNTGLSKLNLFDVLEDQRRKASSVIRKLLLVFFCNRNYEDHSLLGHDTVYSGTPPPDYMVSHPI